MTRPPIRLLEGTEASAAERALLEAGRSVPAVHYDVAAGAAKFQAALQVAATAAPVTTTTALVKTATLSKLALVLVPTLGAVAAYYVMRNEAPAIGRAAAPTVVEPSREVVVPPSGSTSIDVAPHTAATGNDAPTTTSDATKPERTRSTRRAAHATSSPRRSSVTTHSHDSVTTTTPAAAFEVADQAHPVAPEDEAEAPDAPPAPEAPTPTVAVDSINELRGIATARALIERDPAAALVILQRLSRAHPQGYFVEERAALTVLALAGKEDEEEARRHAARFLKTYPTSPFADRVRNAVR